MPIFDAQGNPVERGLSVMELAKVISQDMQRVDQAFQLMHRQLFLLEVKNNFLFKKASEAGILGKDIEKEWQEFASAEVKKGEEQMRKMMEAAEAEDNSIKEEGQVIL